MTRRRVIGLAGCPGSGKSTLAAGLAAAEPDTSIVVPMDGFHLAQRELDRLGRADRKGAPDTFDVDGYVALLERLRSTPDRTVLALDVRGSGRRPTLRLRTLIAASR